DNHPITATALNNLGGLLKSQGDDAGARPYYEQALAIRKKVLGDNHTDTAGSLSNLGFLLHAQGDYAGARPYVEQTLAITGHNLELVAAAQSEREQLAMSNNLRYQLDAYLSVALRSGVAPTEVYQQVLAWKGAVFVRRRRFLRDR